MLHHDAPVLCGFNGRLVANSPGATQPYSEAIKYEQYMRYMSQWFGGIFGLSPKEFRAQYGSNSCRSGGASAAANAGISQELWGQHGDWASWEAQRGYMQAIHSAILSVSRAAMQQPEQPDAPGTPVRGEDARVEGAEAFEADERDEDIWPLRSTESLVALSVGLMRDRLEAPPLCLLGGHSDPLAADLVASQSALLCSLPTYQWCRCSGQGAGPAPASGSGRKTCSFLAVRAYWYERRYDGSTSTGARPESCGFQAWTYASDAPARLRACPRRDAAGHREAADDLCFHSQCSTDPLLPWSPALPPCCGLMMEPGGAFL